MLKKIWAANDVTVAHSLNLQLLNDQFQETTIEVDTNETEEATETVETEADETEVQESNQEEVKQDVTQTQAFSRRLNEERARIAQEARDSVIAEQGYVWNGRPIKTESEYKQALYEKELQDVGQDPETVQKLINEHPEVVSARQAKKNMEQWVQLTSEHSDIKDVSQIPPEAIQLYRNGVPLLDAYNRVLIKNQKAQIDKVKLETEQETIRKIQKNATSSPGSALDNGVVHKTKSVDEMTDEEFAAYREEVRKQRRDD